MSERTPAKSAKPAKKRGVISEALAMGLAVGRAMRQRLSMRSQPNASLERPSRHVCLTSTST